MKSAEEWMGECAQTHPCESLMAATITINADGIRAIQRDALEAAAAHFEDWEIGWHISEAIRAMKPEEIST